jgi:hypothetical protein
MSMGPKYLQEQAKKAAAFLDSRSGGAFYANIVKSMARSLAASRATNGRLHADLQRALHAPRGDEALADDLARLIERYEKYGNATGDDDLARFVVQHKGRILPLVKGAQP